jgi:hypothetical protein
MLCAFISPLSAKIISQLLPLCIPIYPYFYCSCCHPRHALSLPRNAQIEVQSKADAQHSHALAQVTGLADELASKAALHHGHYIQARGRMMNQSFVQITAEHVNRYSFLTENPKHTNSV